MYLLIVYITQLYLQLIKNSEVGKWSIRVEEYWKAGEGKMDGVRDDRMEEERQENH